MVIIFCLADLLISILKHNYLHLYFISAAVEELMVLADEDNL